MKVYTSYFARAGKLIQANVTPIGIALYPPKFFYGSSISCLAPKRYMLNDKLSEEEYTQLYIGDVLSKINIPILKDTMLRMSNEKDIALLCYEKPGEFCHRHIFSRWWLEETGELIEEWGVKIEERKPDIQRSLF